MEVFDPSQVKVSNQNLNIGNITYDTEYHFNDEIKINGTDFEINVNGSALVIENYEQPQNSNSMYIYTDDYSITTSSGFFSWDFTFRTSVKNQIINFFNSNPNKTFRFSVTLGFKKDDLGIVNWDQKRLSTNNCIFSIIEDVGNISGNFISANFNKNTTNNNDLFKISVGTVAISPPEILKSQAIKIEAFDLRARSLATFSKISELENNNETTTSMILNGNNSIFKCQNNGFITSNELNLVSDCYCMELSNSRFNTKFYGEDVLTFKTLEIDSTKTCKISINNKFISPGSGNTLAIDNNGILVTNQISLCVIKIENGTVSIVKSRNVDSVHLENNLIKINFGSEVDIHFPHIQFHSETNSNPTFKVVSDLTNPVKTILLSPSSLENGTLYLKFD